MDIASFVALQGGACTKDVAVDTFGGAAVSAALASGTLTRPGRGRLALPTSPEHVRRAASFAGVLSHRSAAARWGWAQKELPARAEITVPRTRKISPHARDLVIPHWSDLPESDVAGQVTTQRRTLVDVSRNLPLDVSLPIVDSALRSGDISREELLRLADSTAGRGRSRIQAVAELADMRAANPFESVLRAQCALIPGLDVVPQRRIVLTDGLELHPDLVCVALKLAIEAEGFEFHGESVRLTHDCRRYNILAMHGWTIIRFSWWMVMHDPAYVQAVLRNTINALLTSSARSASAYAV